VHANGAVLVVAQVYDADVNKEYAIQGNSAVLKCQVPSFVADFVHVVSWHTDKDESFYPGEDYGNSLAWPPGQGLILFSFQRAEMKIFLKAKIATNSPV